MNMKWLLIALTTCLMLTAAAESGVEEKNQEKAGQVKHSDNPLFARFVPERADDFAWENDLVAFRAYGPALRNQVNAGTDCWLKRVKYPIINKWYHLALKENISYHEDHGEGLDNYHVGPSAGCGGTSLWINEQREALGTYTGWSDLTITDEKLSFTLQFNRAIGSDEYSEKKRVTLIPGVRLFKVVSTFYKNGKVAKELPVSVGVTTHDGKAKVTFNKNEKWLASWENLDGSGLGTGIYLDSNKSIEPSEIKHSGKPDQAHALYITRTNNQGQITYYAGYGWAKAKAIKTEKQWQQYLSDFARQTPY